MRSYQNQLFFLNQLAPTTSERYCNKSALKGILEQKIKEVAAPTNIQIQKFDKNGGRRQWHQKVSKK